MNKKTLSTIAMTTLHIVTALIAAVIATGFSFGWFGIKNDLFGALLSLIILYITGQLSQKLFSDEISGFKSWLSAGIIPFYFIWVIAYTILFNYL